MRRIERLFAIAEHLRTRRAGVTAEALAERFGVSVRTMYRDLDALRGASLPVEAEPGPGGGYQLSRAYTLPPIHFTVAEATVLVAAARWMRQSRQVPFFATLDDAAERIRAALPPRVRVAVDRRIDALSFVGVPALAPDEAVRRAVEEAWRDDRELRITYDGARGRTVRRIRIRSVVVDRREALLNADDLDVGEPRQFQLHRIAEAAIVEPSL
jgi:predicted DNA-binding transcriptional regulator YafY